MARILVSLLSDQSIPNIRFIKEKQRGIDKFVFIGTKEMQEKKKLQSYINALNISRGKTKEIIVDAFNMALIEENLLNSELNEDDEYLVNITGGTKPMSIACLSYFSSFPKSKVYYIAIGEGVYRQVHPRLEQPQTKFLKEITLKEYFFANELELQAQESKISRSIVLAQTILEKFIKHKGDISRIDKVRKAHEMTNSDDKSYYSGGWFEELIFYKIKQKFNLNLNQIAYNVKLLNQKSKNEYDAVFVYDDSIYIVECKAYYGKNGLRAKIEKDLYKLGALDDDFGLKVNAVYITTADIKGNSLMEYESLMERANTLGVKLFQLSDLQNDYFINKI